MIACYKYNKERRGNGGLTLRLEKIFKLGDNTGMKSNRYKLVINRFMLEIGRQFQTIRAARFQKAFQQEEEGQNA